MEYYAEVKTHKVVGKVNCRHLVKLVVDNDYSSELLPGNRELRMKVKNIVKRTANNRVYSRALKHLRENKGEVNCAYCPYHKMENQTYCSIRSWKKYRRTQYKVVKFQDIDIKILC